jgi:hypothetical protein
MTTVWNSRFSQLQGWYCSFGFLHLVDSSVDASVSEKQVLFFFIAEVGRYYRAPKPRKSVIVWQSVSVRGLRTVASFRNIATVTANSMSSCRFTWRFRSVATRAVVGITYPAGTVKILACFLFVSCATLATVTEWFSPTLRIVELWPAGRVCGSVFLCDTSHDLGITKYSNGKHCLLVKKLI